MNNRPLSTSILINRLQTKHKEITDYKLAEFVEWFWKGGAAIDYYGWGYNTPEIIKQKLGPWLLQVCKNHLRRAINHRKFEIQYKKFQQDMKREFRKLKPIWEQRKVKREQKRALSQIHGFLNPVRGLYNDMINKNCTKQHAENSIKLHFGFLKIPNWLWWSDKQILKNIRMIRIEILNALEIMKIRKTDTSFHSRVTRDCDLCVEQMSIKLDYYRAKKQRFPKYRDPKTGKMTLSQDTWDVYAELKGKKKWRWQSPIDNRKDERERALQDELDVGRGDLKDDSLCDDVDYGDE